MKTLKIFKRKISYFDIGLTIAVLAVAIGLFFFFYRKNTYVNIRVKITDQDVLYAINSPSNWYANQFEVGDSERDQLGRITSEIIKVETFNVDDKRKAVYLNLRIKSVYDKRTKTYSAKGTNLIFGNTIRLYFSKVSTNALIVQSPNSSSQNNLKILEKTITVIQRGLLTEPQEPIEPEVLESIKRGDTIKNSNGEVLAEVVNVNILPAQNITQNSQGDLLLRFDPYYKDALMELKVKVYEFKGQNYVFDNYPLVLGNHIPLNFSYTSIYPTIIEVK